jgi:aspartyl-tRNA(Asn)/glutamyl-tRNA(Gln) amidotransferase subunit A
MSGKTITEDQGFASAPGRLPDLAKRIAEKSLSPVDLVRDCLDRIATVEPLVLAWQQLDGDRALELAQQRAKEAAQGRLRGPLHGIPIGVKDIIDVEGLPTRCNSKSRAMAAPATADAEIVMQLKTQGAIVLGKTHTTEFAFFDPSPARNPWNIKHTPGGSSSGSAAAVAAGMVPLSLGTQTTASLNRPAAYCGIAGYKPSTRSIPATVSRRLPRRTIQSDSMVARSQTPFMHSERFNRLMSPIGREADAVEVVSLIDTLIDDAKPDATRAWQEMAKDLEDAGIKVSRVASPISFAHLRRLHWQTQIFEMSRTLRDFLNLETGQIGSRLIATLREGLDVPEADYLEMCSEIDRLRTAFFGTFRANQVFLWPAAPGTAPEGLASTGDPRYIAPWTALGSPVVTIPAGLGDDGLPLGCILCHRPGRDALLGDVALRFAPLCERSAL